MRRKWHHPYREEYHLLRADTSLCELLSCCEADFKSHRNNFRSCGENFARDDSFERCMVMLVANIGGICKLGKFWVRDLAFILKMQGVCVI